MTWDLLREFTCTDSKAGVIEEHFGKWSGKQIGVRAFVKKFAFWRVEQWHFWWVQQLDWGVEDLLGSNYELLWWLKQEVGAHGKFLFGGSAWRWRFDIHFGLWLQLERSVFPFDKVSLLAGNHAGVGAEQNMSRRNPTEAAPLILCVRLTFQDARF